MKANLVKVHSTSRRRLLAGLAAIPLSVGGGSALRAQDKQEADTALTGSWFVTSAVNSVILSIEPDGQALVLLLESGSFSMARTTWRALPGGVLVEGLPRFRLWAGPHNQRLRAGMDLPAGIEVGNSWREFPETFFMSRIEQAQVPKLLRDRPLPAGWEQAVLGEEWDRKAGHRRQKATAGVEPAPAPVRR